MQGIITEKVAGEYTPQKDDKEKTMNPQRQIEGPTAEMHNKLQILASIPLNVSCRICPLRAGDKL